MQNRPYKYAVSIIDGHVYYFNSIGIALLFFDMVPDDAWPCLYRVRVGSKDLRNHEIVEL